MAKTVEDLREHLFATLAELRAGTMDVDKAKAVSEVAQTIINSAKVEVDYQRVQGGTGGSRFLGVEGKPEPEKLPAGVRGVVTHRLKG